jgi:hypothetical protein
MVSSSYPRPRRGGVGVGAIGKTSSPSQPLSLRDVEREVEDVFETHSVAEIREVRLVNRWDRIDWFSLFRKLPFSTLAVVFLCRLRRSMDSSRSFHRGCDERIE